MECSPKAEDI